MILAIDIGNTDIAIGGFNRYGALQFTLRISTDSTRSVQEYEGVLSHLLSTRQVSEKDVEGAIISSVVPLLSSTIATVIEDLYGVRAMHVCRDLDIGIDVKCDEPSTVGSDLLCACVAAHFKYGSPALIVDMGTATKMMVTDDGGAFIGVSIMPGVMMGMRSLSSGTAQLPQFGLKAPTRAIGKNTVDCLKSGAVYGNAAMVDGMIDRLSEEFGRELPIFATGGFSRAIIGHCKHSITLDDNMVLEGLYIIYERNAKRA